MSDITYNDEGRLRDLDAFKITQPDEEVVEEAIETLEGFREFQRDNKSLESI